MKTKMLVVFFMLMVSFFAKAEKTYRHDHTLCNYKGEKIHLDIRSFEEFSDSSDDEYGEVVLITHQGKSIKVNLQNQGIGRYTLLKNYNDYCPKVLAMPVKGDEIAFFLMKDNRPFADQVMVLYFNIKTQDAEIMATKINSRSGFLKDRKVYLKVAKDNREEKYGTVVIGNEKFNYIEKNFEPWVSFDGKNFQFDRQVTQEKFEHKKLLSPSLLDGFDAYKENKYKLAVNPMLKKSCISLNNSEWVCN